MRSVRIVVAGTVFLVAACSSSSPARIARPHGAPPHAITVTLSLSGVQPWEPEWPACHGTGSLDDLKVGTPVTVYAAGKRIASGQISTTHAWVNALNKPDTCTLTATIPAVPAAAAYTFKFGDRTVGSTVNHDQLGTSWTANVQL